MYFCVFPRLQLTHLEDVRNRVREGVYLSRVFFFFSIHFNEIVEDNNLWETSHFNSLILLTQIPFHLEKWEGYLVVNLFKIRSCSSDVKVHTITWPRKTRDSATFVGT